MAEPLLDDLDRDAPPEEHGRVPVPEVVQGPPPREPKAPVQRNEIIGPEVVVVKRLPVRLREDQVEGVPARAVRPETLRPTSHSPQWLAACR